MQQLAVKSLNIVYSIRIFFEKQILLQAAFFAVFNIGEKALLWMFVASCDSQSSGVAL